MDFSLSREDTFGDRTELTYKLSKLRIVLPSGNSVNMKRKQVAKLGIETRQVEREEFVI
jgi:hypothetical protein